MKKNISFWMLGIAAMLASCSQDEVLQGMDNSGGVTITARLEESMRTRAVMDGVTEENKGIDNYRLEVYYKDENGDFVKDETLTQTKADGIFSVKLDKQKTYKFYCWADEGDESAYNSEDLSVITLKDNKVPTIAHCGASDEVSGEATGAIEIQMKHAVAKVVLKTTTPLSANSAKVATSSCNSYNAISDTYSGSVEVESEVGPTEEITTASTASTAEVLSFYLLVGKETNTVTVSYTTTANDFSNPYTLQLNNVPFEADYRTILVGNITPNNTVSVTASLDTNWEDDVEREFPDAGRAINLSTEELSVELIAEAIGDGNALTLTGDMTNEDAVSNFAVIRSYLKAHTDADLTVDLSGVTTLTEIPNNAFYLMEFVDGDPIELTGVSAVILPEGITRINSRAFMHCPNLKSFDIPSSLESLGIYVFASSGISGTMELPDSFTTMDVDGQNGNKSFEGSKISELIFPESFAVNEYERFYNMTELTKITIYGQVTAFSNQFAFYGSTKLTDIYLPNATTAPTAASEYYGITSSNITLHVPSGCTNEYSAWADLGFNIVEIGTATE